MKRLASSIKSLANHITSIGFITTLLYIFQRFSYPAGRQVRIKTNGLPHPFFLRTKTYDTNIFYQIFIGKEVDFAIAGKPNIIVDAGANIGLSSLFFTRKFKTSQIYSIEPEKSNYDLLVKNTKEYSHIHPINAALWDKDQLLNIVDNGEGNASFQTSESVIKNTISQIQGMSMQHFMSLNNLNKIDLLKIDIEGSEFELFNSENIDWIDAVDNIAIEIHDNIKPGATNLITKRLEKKYNQVRYGEYILFSKK